MVREGTARGDGEAHVWRGRALHAVGVGACAARAAALRQGGEWLAQGGCGRRVAPGEARGLQAIANVESRGRARRLLLLACEVCRRLRGWGLLWRRRLLRRLPGVHLRKQGLGRGRTGFGDGELLFGRSAQLPLDCCLLVLPLLRLLWRRLELPVAGAPRRHRRAVEGLVGVIVVHHVRVVGVRWKLVLSRRGRGEGWTYAATM